MQAPNAPTPGTTNPSAESALFGSEVITTSWPVSANALSADRKFPEP